MGKNTPGPAESMETAGGKPGVRGENAPENMAAGEAY